MNIVIWVQYDTVRTQKKSHGDSLLKPAFATLNALDRVNILGVVESVPTPINQLNTIDKSEVAALDYDLILVTGHDVDLAPIIAEAEELGLDTNKIVLDRTVCVPGFTPARYKELRNSKLSILSDGWWAGLAYHQFGLPALSPTVGMYTSEENFINFLPEARWHLKKDLHFERTEYNADFGINFPVFWLDGTQWFMNSYKSDADALEAWNARKDKINWDNVLVTMHTSSCRIRKKLVSCLLKRTSSRAFICVPNCAAEICCGLPKASPRARLPLTTCGTCCFTARKRNYELGCRDSKFLISN